MKHLVLALGLGLAVAAAAPALAQQGGHIVKRPQADAECARGDRNCAKARKGQQSAKPQAPSGSQFGASPGAAGQPLGAGAGAGRKDPPSAFNSQLKPLGGPGYLPGQLGR